MPSSRGAHVPVRFVPFEGPDGIGSAWEWLLAMARLAHRLAGERLAEDALHCAARQDLALFAGWRQATWTQAAN